MSIDSRQNIMFQTMFRNPAAPVLGSEPKPVAPQVDSLACCSLIYNVYRYVCIMCAAFEGPPVALLSAQGWCSLRDTHKHASLYRHPCVHLHHNNTSKCIGTHTTTRFA